MITSDDAKTAKELMELITSKNPNIADSQKRIEDLLSKSPDRKKTLQFLLETELRKYLDVLPILRDMLVARRKVLQEQRKVELDTEKRRVNYASNSNRKRKRRRGKNNNSD